MKDNPLYNAIDTKFIEAVDEIIAINKQLGIKPTNDSAIGNLVYPTNRSIISAVRGRAKHIPHLALINLAKAFDVNMNYFYTDAPLSYQPSHVYNIKVNNGVYNTGNKATTIHAGKGHINSIHNGTKENVSSPLVGVELNEGFNAFIELLDKDQVTGFLTIIAKVQSDYRINSQALELLLTERSNEIKLLRERHKKELDTLHSDVKDIRKKLDEAINREVGLLRQLANLK